MKVRTRRLVVHQAIAFMILSDIARNIKGIHETLMLDSINHGRIISYEPVPVKQTYICIRQRDGVQVGQFDTEAEANALIEKHVKQKKAKLFILRQAVTAEVRFPSPTSKQSLTASHGLAIMAV